MIVSRISRKKLPTLLEETPKFQIVFRNKVPTFRLSSGIKPAKNSGTFFLMKNSKFGTFFLSQREFIPVKSDFLDIPIVDRFSTLDSSFSMLGCVWYLADRRSLLSVFDLMHTALCVMLSTGRTQLIFASCCSLMAVRCS